MIEPGARTAVPCGCLSSRFQPFVSSEGPRLRMEHSRPGVTPSQGRESVEPRSGDVRDVALAAAGDTQAFRRLYEAHAGRIHSLARSEERRVGKECGTGWPE